MQATFFDLLLMQQASNYNILDMEERNRSNDDITRFFYAIQKITNPSFTLEIGAYDAGFSTKMDRDGFRAIAFEANPYNFAHFSTQPGIKNSNVEYRHLAISDVDGFTEFNIQKMRGGKPVAPIQGTNSILRRDDPNVEYETVRVPSAKLQSVLASDGLVGQPFSAWMDVEGAISMVLDGAGRSFEDCLSLIIEVEQLSYWKGQALATDVLDRMLSYGLVPALRDFQYQHQYNVVFLRKDIFANSAVRYELVKTLSETQRRFQSITKS